MAELTKYRETLERVRGGTIPAELGLEILDAAERELARASGEYTVAQAAALSGKSRSWFTRRLMRLQQRGLARRAGRTWLIQAAAIPQRGEAHPEGFDPNLGPDEIAERLLSNVAA